MHQLHQENEVQIPEHITKIIADLRIDKTDPWAKQAQGTKLGFGNTRHVFVNDEANQKLLRELNEYIAAEPNAAYFAVCKLLNQKA